MPQLLHSIHLKHLRSTVRNDSQHANICRLSASNLVIDKKFDLNSEIRPEVFYLLKIVKLEQVAFDFFQQKNIFRRPSSLQIDHDLMNYFLLGRCPFRFAENVIVKELLKFLARTRLVTSSSGTSLTNSGKGGESIFIAICANTCKSMNHTDAVLLRPPSVQVSAVTVRLLNSRSPQK